MLATAEPAKAHAAMPSTLMIMNICCLLLVGGSLKRIRFGPFREVGFRVIDGLGKQSALCQLTPAGLRMADCFFWIAGRYYRAPPRETPSTHQRTIGCLKGDFTQQSIGNLPSL